MPAISKPVPSVLLRRLRRMGKPLGGKAELAALTGLSRPAISDIILKGTALPATIKKLQEAFNPQNAPA